MVALRYESSRHVEKATSSGLFYVWLSAQLLSYSATQLLSYECSDMPGSGDGVLHVGPCPVSGMLSWVRVGSC
ncbi:hypothetical protein D3C76_1261100 [compost metagenome]